MRFCEFRFQNCEKTMCRRKKKARLVEKKMEKLLEKMGKKSHYIFFKILLRFWFLQSLKCFFSPARPTTTHLRPTHDQTTTHLQPDHHPTTTRPPPDHHPTTTAGSRFLFSYKKRKKIWLFYHIFTTAFPLFSHKAGFLFSSAHCFFAILKTEFAKPHRSFLFFIPLWYWSNRNSSYNLALSRGWLNFVKLVIY